MNLNWRDESNNKEFKQEKRKKKEIIFFFSFYCSMLLFLYTMILYSYFHFLASGLKTAHNPTSISKHKRAAIKKTKNWEKKSKFGTKKWKTRSDLELKNRKKIYLYSQLYVLNKLSLIFLGFNLIKFLYSWKTV